MSLDTEALREAMIAAARDAVRERWPHIQTVAAEQFGILAASLDSVARLAASGAIDESRARQHAHVHQITTRSILAATKGLGTLTAEQATHAAVRSVAKVINTAVKFALL